MKIKRFLELFDTEDLKSEHEIDYLTGRFQNIANDVDVDFKNETIGRLIYKISSYHFPFFDAFIDHLHEELEFETFEIKTTYDPESKYWIFTTQSDTTISLGIKVDSVNEHDIFLLIDEDGTQYKDLEFSELIEFIRNFYIPMLIENDFVELLNYNDKNIVHNN